MGNEVAKINWVKSNQNSLVNWWHNASPDNESTAKGRSSSIIWPLNSRFIVVHKKITYSINRSEPENPTTYSMYLPLLEAGGVFQFHFNNVVHEDLVKKYPKIVSWSGYYTNGDEEYFEASITYLPEKGISAVIQHKRNLIYLDHVYNNIYVLYSESDQDDIGRAQFSCPLFPEFDSIANSGNDSKSQSNTNGNTQSEPNLDTKLKTDSCRHLKIDSNTRSKPNSETPLEPNSDTKLKTTSDTNLNTDSDTHLELDLTNLVTYESKSLKIEKEAYFFKILLIADEAVCLTHGKNKISLMFEFVKLINRVNVILQREVAVSLQLHPNTDKLMCLESYDGLYDDRNNKFGNFKFIQKRGIEPSTCDIVRVVTNKLAISSSQNTVCSHDNKAIGVVGNKLENSAVLVTLFAHSICHSLGAEHTFMQCNTEENDSKSSVTSFDGASLMSNCGNCRHRLYMDAGNRDKINKFLRTINCGQKFPLQIPDIQISPEISETSQCELPSNSFFRLGLTGLQEKDWLSIDVVTSIDENAKCNDRSVTSFRSWEPTDRKYRYFPSERSIGLDTKENVSEIAPQNEQTFTFRFTIHKTNTFPYFKSRKIKHSGFSIHKSIDRIVSFVNKEPISLFPLDLYKQKESLEPNRKVKICWNAPYNRDQSEVNVSVRLYISLHDKRVCLNQDDPNVMLENEQHKFLDWVELGIFQLDQVEAIVEIPNLIPKEKDYDRTEDQFVHIMLAVGQQDCCQLDYQTMIRYKAGEKDKKKDETDKKKDEKKDKKKNETDEKKNEKKDKKKNETDETDEKKNEKKDKKKNERDETDEKKNEKKDKKKNEKKDKKKNETDEKKDEKKDKKDKKDGQI